MEIPITGGPIAKVIGHISHCHYDSLLATHHQKQPSLNIIDNHCNPSSTIRLPISIYFYSSKQPMTSAFYDLFLCLMGTEKSSQVPVSNVVPPGTG